MNTLPDPLRILELEAQALALGERVGRTLHAERLAWLAAHPEEVPHPVWDAILDENGHFVGSKVDAALANALENPAPSFEDEETIRTLRVLSVCSRDPFALSRFSTTF